MGNCPCAVCNEETFRFWYGTSKPRKSHAETILAKRKKREAIAYRRELHAKLRLEKEERKLKKESKRRVYEKN